MRSFSRNGRPGKGPSASSFFFSSRRRHTRSLCDWSSDVCSSDLNYGTESGNPHCANCMVHSGYEASAVNDTFGSLSGFLATVKATFSRYPDPGALRLLEEPVAPGHPLVQIATPSESLEETRA